MQEECITEEFSPIIINSWKKYFCIIITVAIDARAFWTKWLCCLTHWDPMTHICVRKLTHIVSDNGLSPCRRQAIIWTKAGILLFGPLGTKFGEILIEIHTFSFQKMHLKMSSGKCRPFCLGLNVLRVIWWTWLDFTSSLVAGQNTVKIRSM